jgi:hypothetical protein
MPDPSNIPTLPENATPEEKDAHWLKYVYLGESQKQLTVRAVLTGGLIGMAMTRRWRTSTHRSSSGGDLASLLPRA